MSHLLITCGTLQLGDSLQDLMPESISCDSHLLQILMTHFHQNLQCYLLPIEQFYQVIQVEAEKKQTINPLTFPSSSIPLT